MKLYIEIDPSNPQSLQKAMETLTAKNFNYAQPIKVKRKTKRASGLERLDEFLKTTIARNNKLLAQGKTVDDYEFDIISRGHITHKMGINALITSEWLAANRLVIDQHHDQLGLKKEDLSRYAVKRNAVKKKQLISKPKPNIRVRIATKQEQDYSQYAVNEWEIKCEEFKNKADYLFKSTAAKRKWVLSRLAYLVHKHDKASLLKFGYPLSGFEYDARFEIFGKDYWINWQRGVSYVANEEPAQ